MRGVVVVADIRRHETPIHSLEALGSGDFVLAGVVLDDLDDELVEVGEDALERFVAVPGPPLAPEQQQTVYDITFRDGGTGMYAWNAEIHVNHRSESI